MQSAPLLYIMQVCNCYTFCLRLSISQIGILSKAWTLSLCWSVAVPFFEIGYE